MVDDSCFSMFFWWLMMVRFRLANECSECWEWSVSKSTKLAIVKQSLVLITINHLYHHLTLLATSLTWEYPIMNTQRNLAAGWRSLLLGLPRITDVDDGRTPASWRGVAHTLGGSGRMASNTGVVNSRPTLINIQNMMHILSGSHDGKCVVSPSHLRCLVLSMLVSINHWVGWWGLENPGFNHGSIRFSVNFPINQLYQ